MSNRSKSKKDLELDILHGTKIIGDCSKCNSIMGMEEGLKENIGGPKMNALTYSLKLAGREIPRPEVQAGLSARGSVYP